MILLLLKCMIAHLLGDFYLQPDRWIQSKLEKKWKSPWLYVHTAIHLFLLFAVTLDLQLWMPILLIAISHFLIDLWKVMVQKPGNEARLFFQDQALHILFMVAIVYLFIYRDNFLLPEPGPEILIVTGSILLLSHPASHLIKNLLAPWTASAKEHLPETLANSGKYIGILERLLVFIFIYSDHWEGVGFLITAKSVFRFGDVKESKEMKLTEYFLIGTLLSFGLAMVIGLAAAGGDIPPGTG